MSEGAVGFAVLISLAIVLGLPAMFMHRHRTVAAAVAAVLASIVFQVLVTFRQGSIEAFLPIALVFGATYAFIAIMLVGMAVDRLRAKRG